MLNGSGECLERAAAHFALPPRGNTSLPPLLHGLRSRALKDVQFSIAAAADPHPVEVRGIPTARNDPEGEGRRPKTPLPLGFRPAGTSLMSSKDGLRCVG